MVSGIIRTPYNNVAIWQKGCRNRGDVVSAAQDGGPTVVDHHAERLGLSDVSFHV